MFEAYKIAIDVSLADQLSVPLTKLAGLLETADAKTSGFQQRLQKMGDALKAGASLFNAGATLAGSFGQAIEKAGELQQQLAGIQTASGDTGDALGGLQGGLAQLFGGAGQRQVADTPAAPASDDGGSEAPALPAAPRPKRAPRKAPAAPAHEAGAEAPARPARATAPRRRSSPAAATAHTAARPGKRASQSHQAAGGMAGQGLSAALVNAAQAQVDKLLDRQFRSFKGAVDSGVQQLGTALAGSAQKLLASGLQQASGFVAAHQQVFQRLAGGLGAVQQAMALGQQIEGTIGAFSDLRSAFAQVGGENAGRAASLLQRLAGGVGLFKPEQMGSLSRAFQLVRGGVQVLGGHSLPQLASALPGVAGRLKGLFDKASGGSPVIEQLVRHMGKFGTQATSMVDVVSKVLGGSGGDDGLVGDLGNFGNSLKMVKAGLAVAVAWDVGQYIGNKINDWLSDDTKNEIGGLIAHVMAWGGDKAAKDAIGVNKKEVDSKVGATDGASTASNSQAKDVGYVASVSPGTVRALPATINVNVNSVLDGKIISSSVLSYLIDGGNAASNLPGSFDPTRLYYNS